MTKEKITIAVLTFIGGALGFILLQGPTALNNLQLLPDAYVQVSNKMKSLYFKDSTWSGTWSASADYEYTYEEGDTSDTDIIINLSVEQGEAHGEFYSKSLCEAAPMLDLLLIDGRVDASRKLHLIAYEMIGGKRRNFIAISASLPSDDDIKKNITTFNIQSGITDTFPTRIRLKKQLNENTEAHETQEYCLTKKWAFIKNELERRDASPKSNH